MKPKKDAGCSNQRLFKSTYSLGLFDERVVKNIHE